MPPTPCDGDDPAPIQSDCVGHAGDDGTGHDAGHLPLGGQRRQLPHRPALFRHRRSRGPCCFGCSFVSMSTVQRMSTCWLAMKSWSPKPANTPMAWIGSFPVCMASRCQGWPSSPCRLVSIQATALVPDPRRAGRAQRRGESGQQGQSGSQEAAPRPPPSVVLGVRRAARTNPRPTSRSRQSWCASQACSTPCCT